jgi:hypothetical protein
LRVLETEVVEGDVGNVLMTYTVTLSAASGKTITVNYATSPGTATSADYTETAGTLTFLPGETQKTITVSIRGDLWDEADETLFANLSGAVNATIGTAQARGLIRDNDLAPALSVQNGVLRKISGKWYVAFNVSLSAPSGRVVTVNYSTSDGTARAGRDYTATSGTLTFQPGETTKTILVRVLRVRPMENAEPFYLTLTNPTWATIAQGRATL